MAFGQLVNRDNLSKAHAARRTPRIVLVTAALVAACLLTTTPARAQVSDVQAAQRLVQIRAATQVVGEDVVARVANAVQNGDVSRIERTIGVVPAITPDGKLYFGVMVNGPASLAAANNAKTNDVVSTLLKQGLESDYGSRGIQVKIFPDAGKIDTHVEAQVNDWMKGDNIVGLWTSKPHCDERCQNLVLNEGWSPLRVDKAYKVGDLGTLTPSEVRALNAEVKQEWKLVEAVATGAADAKELSKLKYFKSGLEASRLWDGKAARMALGVAGKMSGPLLALAMGDGYWEAAKQGLYGVPVVGELMMANDVITTTISIGQGLGQGAANAVIFVKKSFDAVLRPLDQLSNEMATLPCPDDTNDNSKPPTTPDDPTNPCRKRKKAGAGGGTMGGSSGGTSNQGNSAGNHPAGSTDSGNSVSPSSSGTTPNPNAGSNTGSNAGSTSGSPTAPDTAGNNGDSTAPANSGSNTETPTPSGNPGTPPPNSANSGNPDQPGAGAAPNPPTPTTPDSPAPNTSDNGGGTPSPANPPTNPAPETPANEPNDGGLPTTGLPPPRPPAEPHSTTPAAPDSGSTPAAPDGGAATNPPATSAAYAPPDPCADPNSPAGQASQAEQEYQKQLDAAKEAATGDAQRQLTAARQAVIDASNETERAAAKRQLETARANYADAQEKFSVQQKAMEKAHADHLRQISAHWSSTDDQALKQCNPEAWNKLETARYVPKPKPPKPATASNPPIQPNKPASPSSCSSGDPETGIVGAMEGVNRKIQGCH